jgi:small-conductance mechanosensitive channel
LKSPAPTAIFKGINGAVMEFELRVHIPEVFDSSVVATRIRFEIFDAFERIAMDTAPVPRTSLTLSLPDLEALAQAIDKVKAKPRRRRPER